MKIFLLILMIIIILPLLFGNTLITTIYSNQLIYDYQKNKNVENFGMDMIHLSINETKEEKVNIPFLYGTIKYSSPYTANWFLHSKFKDVELLENYLLINNKEKINFDNKLSYNGKHNDNYVYKTDEQKIVIDLENTKYIDFIIKYKVNNKIIKNSYRYNVKYKKETGNSLLWAIMSV